MKLDKYTLYFSRTLMDYLKEMGLPYSKPTLIRYEKKGVIKSPRARVGKEGFTWRIYTGEEIEQIAEGLKVYLISKYK